MKKLIVLILGFLSFVFVAKAQPSTPEWKMVTIPGLPNNALIVSIWTKQEGKVFIAVNQYAHTDTSKVSVYYYNGVNWSIQLQLQGGKRGVTGSRNLFGTNENDVFLNVRNSSANVSEVYHYNGITWQQQNMPVSIGSGWMGNFVGESNNVLVGVDNNIYKYNGTSWDYVTNIGHGATNLIYINANEIYAVECWGHSLWNGSNWTWYQGFDFCDVTSGWGMRDADNNLFLFATGGNNFGNGVRVWRFVESTKGSKIGSWGSKYDCTYLCDPTGTGYAWAGWGTAIWGTSPNDIYVAGNFGHPYNPNYSTRIYYSDGTFPFTRMTIFDSMPLITNASNYGTQNITGSGPNDVWASVGNMLAHFGIPITTISITNQSIILGEPIEIPITTTTLNTTDNIISYQLNLDYDQTKLQYTDKSLAGTIVDGGSVVVNSSTPGHLQISYMTSTPLTGAGNILKLQFNTLAEGASPLTISNFLYNTTAVTSITNGTVTINENIPPTAVVTYSDADGFVSVGKNITITATFSEPMADTPIPQIALNGANTLASTNMTKVSNTVYTFSYTVASGRGPVDVSLSTGTDLVGNVVVATPTSGASFEIIRYGDIDDNTFIQAYDAALTLQYSVGLDPLPVADPLPWEAWRIATANVDGAGSITAYDASLILQYSAGIITSFPTGSKKSGNENAEIKIIIDKRFIQFRSKGELFGLNISIPKDFNNLGQPQILNSDMISAININQTTYTVGLATAYPPKNGDVFLKIPIVGSTGSDLIFNMTVNAENVTVTVNLATGILEINENSLSMFPNPVTNELTINSISKNATISIYDLTGKLLISIVAKSATEIIDVSGLADGAYTVKITDNRVTKTGKLIKQ